MSTKLHPTLNIYLVQRTDEVGYDQYAGFICICSSAAAAYLTAPTPDPSLLSAWPPRTGFVTVTCLGRADATETPRVVLADFRAG